MTLTAGLSVDSSLQLLRLSCCNMRKTQCSKINHKLASYMKTPAVYIKSLAEFAQLCVHHVINHGQTLRTADMCKASQSFAVALLALFI